MKRVRIDRTPKKHPGGRPATYRPDFARMAEVHCKLGATDADLADLFDVSTQAILNWRSRYPEFREAVTRGKAEIFDPMVERSLAQRALGYSVDTEEVKVTSTGVIVRYPVRKHYPPDVTACIFWLKNRNPEAWKDVQDHILRNRTLEKLTSKELLEEIQREAQELGIMPPNPKRGNNGKVSTTHH